MSYYQCGPKGCSKTSLLRSGVCFITDVRITVCNSSNHHGLVFVLLAENQRYIEYEYS